MSCFGREFGREPGLADPRIAEQNNSMSMTARHRRGQVSAEHIEFESAIDHRFGVRDGGGQDWLASPSP
ncbi:hypothetical protein Acsp01_47160 [Actinoplanes sp. NBRC 101535]|nr:hypothetical protein Acsp01_47160 [Actinoplanes sp. NBRC 101535]